MLYYVIGRGEDRRIVKVAEGQDPLYGYGSWSLISGPYRTYIQAVFSMDFTSVESAFNR